MNKERLVLTREVVRQCDIVAVEKYYLPSIVLMENAGIIAALNNASCEIISLDVPSGLDCNSGLPQGCSVVATQTITFVAIKVGFLVPPAAQYIGNVTVVDIGIAPNLLVELI